MGHIANDFCELVKKYVKTRETVKPEHTFKELGIDSLDILELTMYAEKKFQIEIADEDLSDCSDVADFITIILDASGLNGPVCVKN